MIWFFFFFLRCFVVFFRSSERFILGTLNFEIVASAKGDTEIGATSIQSWLRHLAGRKGNPGGAPKAQYRPKAGKKKKKHAVGLFFWFPLRFSDASSQSGLTDFSPHSNIYLSSVLHSHSWLASYPCSSTGRIARAGQTCSKRKRNLKVSLAKREVPGQVARHGEARELLEQWSAIAMLELQRIRFAGWALTEGQHRPKAGRCWFLDTVPLAIRRLGAGS